MKFKKNWKRFFKLDRHCAEGFTLVELIVVIAILAILAGVAVPAYSGYIEKANVAADEVLLSTLNTAFASACAFKGVDMASINAVDNWTGKAVTSVSVSDSEDDTAVQDLFLEFYGDSVNSEFKVFTDLMYTVDGFICPAYATGDITVSYGGSYITISAADAQNLANSTYGTVIGAAGLLNKVNDVAGFASALDASASYNAVITDPEFMKTLLTSFGMTAEEVDALSDAALLGTYGAYVDYLATEQITAGKATDLETARSQVKANLAVLHAAQNTTTMDSNTINSLLNSSDPKNTIITALNNDPGEGLAQAALFYGLYTSFANTEKYGTTTRQEATSDPISLLKGLDEDELKDFQAYINSDQGQADLNAYISSMEMVNSGTTSPETTQNVLINGYNNQELIDLLAGVMGN